MSRPPSNPPHSGVVQGTEPAEPVDPALLSGPAFISGPAFVSGSALSRGAAVLEEPVVSVREGALAEVAQSLRAFDGHPSLDRVWARVARAVPEPESMMSRGSLASAGVAAQQGAALRPRRLRSRTWVQASAGVALVAAGVLMGIYLERTLGTGTTYLAQSENAPGTLGQLPAARPAERPALPQQPTQTRGQAIDGLSPNSDQSRTSAVRTGSRRRTSVALLAQDSLPSAASGVVAPSSAVPLATETGLAEVVVAPGSVWRGLAERGDFVEAAAALESAGGFEQALLRAGPDELMTLADVARAVGRPALAVQALRGVLDQYRDNENAPLAAMTLGNLLRNAGDAVGAAEAFALNRRLSPGGDFAEDALVREFDMAMEATDLTEAQRLQAQYEREYPEGRHSEVLRAEVERLAAELAPPVLEDEEDAEGDQPGSGDASDEQPPVSDAEPHAPVGEDADKAAEQER